MLFRSGSLDIQHIMWTEVNSGDIIEAYEGNVGHGPYYCPECHFIDHYITLREWNEVKAQEVAEELVATDDDEEAFEDYQEGCSCEDCSWERARRGANLLTTPEEANTLVEGGEW